MSMNRFHVPSAMFILESHVSIPFNKYLWGQFPANSMMASLATICRVDLWCPSPIYFPASLLSSCLFIFIPLGLWTFWAIEILPQPHSVVLSWSPREIIQISWDQVWSTHEWKSMPLDDQESACCPFVLSPTCEHGKKPAPWHRGQPAQEASHNHAGPIILDFQPLELSSIYLQVSVSY